jgi:hypothetical protein
MFITLTIDTTQKKNKSKIRLNKSSINPAKGWRGMVHMKKRSVWQKLKSWKKSLKPKKYTLNGQPVMF